MKSPNRFQRVLGYAMTVIVVMAAVYYGTASYYKGKIEQTKSAYLATLRQLQLDYSKKGPLAYSNDAARLDRFRIDQNLDQLPLSFRQESYVKWLAQGMNYQFETPGRISLTDMMRLFGHLTVQYNDRDSNQFYFRPFSQESDAFSVISEIRADTRWGRDRLTERKLIKWLDLDHKSIVIPDAFKFYQYEIINRGNRTVTAPILYNDVLWNTTQHIVATSGLAEIENETDRALALWRFIAQNRYHFYPVTNSDEEVDVVKYLSVYGYGWCGESALVLAKLADEIGLKGRVWELEGHVVPEVFADGQWILLDPDRLVYFHEPGDLKAIYGVEELSRNKEAFTHAFSIAPADVQERFKPYKEAYIQYFMSTRDNVLNELDSDDADGRTIYGKMYATGATSGFSIDDSLRPGEKVVFTNYNWGKYFLGMFPFRVPKYFNGYYEYTAPVRDVSVSSEHCAVERTPLGSMITNRSSEQAACIRIDNWYYFPVVGGEINGRIRKRTGQLNVVLKDDDNNLTASYAVDQFQQSNGDLQIRTDKFFSIISDYPTYHYSIAFEFEPGTSVVLDEPLTVISDFQFAEMALLKLQQGENRFKVYGDSARLPSLKFKLSVL